MQYCVGDLIVFIKYAMAWYLFGSKPSRCKPTFICCQLISRDKSIKLEYNDILSRIGHFKISATSGRISRPLLQFNPGLTSQDVGCTLIDMEIRNFNSLTPGKCGNVSDIKSVVLRITFMSTSCEITLRTMSQNTSDDTSTLAQVMACCRQPMLTQLCHNMASLSHNELTLLVAWDAAIRIIFHIFGLLCAVYQTPACI